MDNIKIGNVTLEKSAALAPMAGVADRVYRLMCREYGAAYTVSEMVSAKGICYSDKKTAELCTITEGERPMGIQLFGYEADFMAEADNPLNLEGFAFSIPNPQERAFLLEGYLFPDTYEFYRNESASSAIRRFLKNTQSKLTDEVARRCEELGYTVDEILTLASIVQEEAGDPAEMGKVSSVIHNRLSSKSYPKLQCDVATFYLRDYVKPHKTEQEYEALTELYNTYNCKGLPAGPITNSGMDAVNAALYPDDTDYYFFVTDSGGAYYYAETWAEHLENCDTAGI